MHFTVLPSTLKEIGSGAFQGRVTGSEDWYLMAEDPSKIEIAEFGFEGVQGLQSIYVNWDLKKALEVQPHLDKGWTISGTVTVRDAEGKSLADL